MHLLAACLFALLALPTSLSAQVWTSPTANWGSVTITAKDGASIDQMRVKAVPGVNAKYTYYLILIPHQFKNGENPLARDYKFDIAYTPHTTNHWKLEPGAEAVQNDIPYTASQQPDEPNLRLGRAGGFVGGAEEIARRKFINPWTGVEGSGTGDEDDDEHTVNFIVFTPGLLIRAYEADLFGLSGTEVSRPAIGGSLYATVHPVPDESGEGPQPPYNTDNTYVRVNLRFKGNGPPMLYPVNLHLEMPGHVRGWDSARTALTPASHLIVSDKGAVAQGDTPASLEAIVTEAGADVWFQLNPESLAGALEPVRLRYVTEFGGHPVEVVDELLTYQLLLTNIRFNHDLDSAENDALNIRKNFATAFDIADGEWQQSAVGQTVNHPVAYLRNKEVSVMARLTVQPPIITSAEVWAEAVSEGDNPSLQNLSQVSVTFQNGVSVGATGDYVEFEMAGETPGTVNKSDDVWIWHIGDINGGEGAVAAGASGPHTVYTLYDAPVEPWKTEANDPRNPWTDVLDFACEWAKGKNDGAAIVGAITTGAYWGFAKIGKTYDAGATRSPDAHSNLTNVIGSTAVDCRDMSAVVQLFADAIGVQNVQVRRVNGPFNTKYHVPIGEATPVFRPFSFHQFGWYEGKVYDACFQLLRSGTGTKWYVPAGAELNGDYKEDLYNPEGGSEWHPQAPYRFQTFE